MGEASEEMSPAMEDLTLGEGASLDEVSLLKEENVKLNKTNQNLKEERMKRKSEINNSTNKLQQLINKNSLLKEQLSQEVTHRRNMEINQTHYQATIHNLNQQLAAPALAYIETE